MILIKHTIIIIIIIIIIITAFRYFVRLYKHLKLVYKVDYVRPIDYLFALRLSVHVMFVPLFSVLVICENKKKRRPIGLQYYDHLLYL